MNVLTLPLQMHLELQVTGVVQGVGFRPFVYRLATQHGLQGEVWNHSRGVTIRVQGEADDIHAFQAALLKELPAPAKIATLSPRSLECVSYNGFAIKESVAQGEAFAFVPPDLALCSECKAEFLDPQNRRAGYPFINCTYCGPRFTIIKSVPYDRAQTTMQPFAMCESCAVEYESPLDRRFHAQPIACPECGPQLEYIANDRDRWSAQSTGRNPLECAADLLLRGGLLLVQGIGGFHLACLATDELAVRELRRRKQREQKPLAVMFPDLAALEEWCVVDESERGCLSSPRAPIVLLHKRATCAAAESVAPESATLGALLPYSPLHVALLEKVGSPLVMTSANLSDGPIEYQWTSLKRRVPELADGALLHGRAIHMFADDSVVRVARGEPRVWRRSRGYVPESVTLSCEFATPILGFGADLKNAFAIGKANAAILTQYLGNLESLACTEAAEQALAHFLNLFDVHPVRAVCDLHPDYYSTRVAESWSNKRSVPLLRVQHHHAHLAACLAEHNETAPTVGLILDGTGYGTDGHVWGGEALFGDFSSFIRVGHLLEVPLIGNDAAAAQPWRMALSWLHAALDKDVQTSKLPLLEELLREYGHMSVDLLLSPALREKFVPTSSMGRLFDAVAAIAGFGLRSQYEGQAAMWLESIMVEEPCGEYPLNIREHAATLQLSPLDMLRAIVEDCIAGVSAGVISRRFHESVARGWTDLCLRALEQCRVNQVALSGGCFQNRFLLERISELLDRRGVRVLIPRDIPPNDGGIALGQICIANAQGA